MRVRRVFPVVGCCLLAATALFAGSSPVAVSPGESSRLVLIGDACPTFSWGQVDGASGYELVVYRLGVDGEEALPVLRQHISDAALGWTPSLDRCLEPGARYAWSVRALTREGSSRWSAPALFQLAARPSQVDFETALQVVRSYLDVGDGVGTTTGTADTQAEPESASAPDATRSSSVPRAVAPTQLSVEGGVEATSFTGDGSGLTDLPWASLSGIPGDLADGDDNTQLDETAVDAFVANNGYAVAASLAAIATSGDWSDLQSIPADIADGDDLGSFGTCYTRWGSWGCSAGFAEVLRGRPGGHESFGSSGTDFGNVECVDSSVGAIASFTGYPNMLMRGDAQGDGMAKVTNRCSVCCTGGCYTALGINTCASGYTVVYSGRTGGTEMFTGPATHGKTLCIDSSATTQYTWASGYNTRLMRHREIAGNAQNGMDQVPNTCAVCCKLE